MDLNCYLEIIDNRVSVFPELEYIDKCPFKPSYIQLF